MTEADFQTLKQEQQFLIEFQNFPEKIQELFDLCSVKDSRMSASHYIPRSYFCTLEINTTVAEENLQMNKSLEESYMVLEEKKEENPSHTRNGVLSIYQANDFKNLLHLKLDLDEGSHA